MAYQFVVVILSLLIWGIFFATFAHDRSRYRNCYFLTFALMVSVFTICLLSGEYFAGTLSFFMLVFFITLLFVPFLLIANGIIMLRKEGFSIANILSLALGIFIAIGEIATFLLLILYTFGNIGFVDDHPVLIAIIGAVSFSVIYISTCILMFVIYSVFLMIIPRKKDFDYVIIHGAGLIDGYKISKLLSDRLDKAIEVYRMDPTPPMMIPSGGKGDNEDITEAQAMAQYLIEHGIPQDMIILEDKSTTTFENLENSKAIIEAREGNKYTTLVSSNYHVYRALRYCRKIGFDCNGIGSRVAPYYWPSALIREFIAIHTEKKHLISLILGWIILMLLIII